MPIVPVLLSCLLAGCFGLCLALPRARALLRRAMVNLGLGGRRAGLAVFGLASAAPLALLLPAVGGHADDGAARYRPSHAAVVPTVATVSTAAPEQAALPPPLPLSPRALAVLGAPDASGNWPLLAPEFARRLLLLFKIMKQQYGYEMTLLEGYRSPARQDLLAAGGAQATRAARFQSYHQYGLAADCAFVRDGKVAISEKDGWTMRAYRRYGETAESLGLHWGGRWAMADFGHVELRLPRTLER